MRSRFGADIEVVAMYGPSGDAVSVFEPWTFPAVVEYSRGTIEQRVNIAHFGTPHLKVLHVFIGLRKVEFLLEILSEELGSSHLEDESVLCVSV